MKKKEKVEVRVAEATREPVYTDPAVMPYKDMEWSVRKKRWYFPDRRSPEQKIQDRIRRKQELALKKKWDFVSRRIPKGWYPGVTCGVGWLPIIKQLVEDVDAAWRGIGGIHPELHWVPVQVKEKFGTLRFYVRPALDISKKAPKSFKEVWDRCWRVTSALISTAEHETASTCEDCGKRGTRRELEGWISTACDECHERHQKERKHGDRR